MNFNISEKYEEVPLDIGGLSKAMTYSTRSSEDRCLS